MARYLVTGGAGFIGSHLAHALVARGDRVRVLDDLSAGREENLAGLAVGPHGSGAAVELLVGSITDPEACRRACEGVEGVFHEAAQVSVPRSLEDPVRSYDVNVTGTLLLLEAARSRGATRFVFASSSAVYGDSGTSPKVEDQRPEPRSPYASGKLAGEGLMQVWGTCYGLRTVALRYFNVYGPRQADDSPYTGVIALFARAFCEGSRPTIYGDGGQTRDFTFVEDVVGANLAAMGADLPPGVVINVGRGESITIRALHDALAEMFDVEQDPQHAPERAGDVRHSLASIERARSLLGWSPHVGWREGLRATAHWYRARHAAAARR
jgi:nucleoside-diphosphate-sugar epimerase